MVSETTKEGRMSKLRQPTCSRVEVGKRYKVISHLGLKLTVATYVQWSQVQVSCETDFYSLTFFF